MHFVLVHGGMYGAWCWYKLIHLLQQSGHEVTAIDLKSAGASPASADSVHSFQEYNQPLMDFFTNLPPTEKIILVGHCFGGTSVTCASEVFPHKITVAVYVCAMTDSGDSLQQKIQSIRKELNQDSIYNFENGPNCPPTSVFLPTHLQKHLLCGESPPSDIILTSLCLRPFPLNVLENIHLETTNENYGTVPRVFIRTNKDCIISCEAQDNFIESSTPKEVYNLDSDHSPFFSQPDRLHQLLLEVATKFTKTIIE